MEHGGRRSASIHCAALTLFASVLGGCYFVPFALPPARATVSGGGAAGLITSPARALDGTPTGHVTHSVAAGSWNARVALHPLQTVSSFHTSAGDFGVGYFVSQYVAPRSSPTTYHGPYVEGEWRPWGLWNNEPGAGAWRLSFSAAADLLLLDVGNGFATGAGVTLATTIELVGFAHQHDFSNVNERSPKGLFFGLCSGEGAIGLQLATSVREVGGAAFWETTLGISVRTPATLGGLVGLLL